MKKVSIVLPVYNLEEYIPECLDSLINQTYKNLEIIVINDGSNDRSLEIINQYKEKDNRIIVLDQPNKGLADSRNRALEIISGDYLFFIDGDDHLVHADSIEKLVTKAEKDNLDILMFNYYRWKNVHNSNRNSIKTLSKGIYKGTELNDLFFILDFYAWNNFFKASFIKQYNIKFPLRYFEDIPWVGFYRLRANRISALDEDIYFYRYHSQSITSAGKGAWDLLTSLVLFKKENIQFFKDDQFSNYFAIYGGSILLSHLKVLVQKTDLSIFKLCSFFKEIKCLKTFLVEVIFNNKKKIDYSVKIHFKPKGIKRIYLMKKGPYWALYIFFLIKKVIYSIKIKKEK